MTTVAMELEELDFGYSPFLKEAKEYKRRIDPLNHYMQQAKAFLLKNNPTATEEEVKSFLNKNLRPDGLFPFKDPKVRYLEKNIYGDREIVEGTLSGYIKDSVKNRHLIAPTFTTYTHPDEKQSYLTDYIDKKVAARKVHKHAQFKAEMTGDYVLAAMENNNQNNAKVRLNSISGASCTPSTPIFRRTVHSTLTSNCRVTSGFANANNEKMLSGNRHYRTPQVTLNNIVSIINNTDYDQLERTMNEYGLHYPSSDVVFGFILRSSRQYWTNKLAEQEIKSYLDKLNRLELAAFLYTGDLYSISRLNGHFAKEMIRNFANPTQPTEELTPEIAGKYVGKFSEEIICLAVQIHRDYFKGIQPLNKTPQTGEYQYADMLPTLVATCLNISHMQQKYALFFDTFFRSNNVPASLAYLPESIRHSALMSDTDSTIFTVQEWIRWVKVAEVVEDKEDIDALLDESFEDDMLLADYFTLEGNAVFAVMVFFAVCTLKHILALMSANHGIEVKRMFQVAMKNEFKFEPFIPTFKTKHYFTQIHYQEGNIYKEPKMEIKGVHLKSSNAPVTVVKQAADFMENICTTVSTGNMIDLGTLLKEVADLERTILSDVDEGGHVYYRTGQVKGKESYTLDETKSNYRHYTFWNEVFGPKYGFSAPPPFSVVKVKTTLDNKARTQAWIQSIEDKELAQRLLDYMGKSEREHFGAFLVPRELFATTALPMEIVEHVDKRSMVSDICVLFYFILETLGIFMSNKNQTKLLSDFY